MILYSPHLCQFQLHIPAFPLSFFLLLVSPHHANHPKWDLLWIEEPTLISQIKDLLSVYVYICVCVFHALTYGKFCAFHGLSISRRKLREWYLWASVAVMVTPFLHEGACLHKTSRSLITLRFLSPLPVTSLSWLKVNRSGAPSSRSPHTVQLH